MYTITAHKATISVPEFIEKFVDVPTFLEACKACPNYGHIWSCPPYDFDVMEYWKRFRTLELQAVRILFDKEVTERSYTKEELDSIINQVIPAEKQKLTDQLLAMEKEHPGSISLSAGSCSTCRNGCTRPCGAPCRYPEGMRYSIESLGGNVGLTIEKLLGLHLEWMEENRLPHHFVLVCGLLLP
ncbi:MAG: DUF2284 domain-containing protein [Eubacteriales bacterium]|nr:DUF2284 domain-containing protein [Eubacteriales bacterium]